MNVLAAALRNIEKLKEYKGIKKPPFMGGFFYVF
jgi:hypothetical protein